MDMVGFDCWHIHHYIFWYTLHYNYRRVALLAIKLRTHRKLIVQAAIVRYSRHCPRQCIKALVAQVVQPTVTVLAILGRFEPEIVPKLVRET